MSLAGKTFTIKVGDPSEPISRSSRRVILHADVLKTAKLVAGDVVALSAADKGSDRTKAFAVGIVWPTQNLSHDSVLVSTPLLLTARLKEGTKVVVQPLAASKSIQGLPSLSQIREARAVRLREVNALVPAKSHSAEKGKRRDWLPLLLREALVDLKYVTPSQTLDVTYEGKNRRFELHSASTRVEEEADAVSALVQDIDGLELERKTQVWTVNWDSIVTIIDGPEGKETNKKAAPQGVDSTVSRDAYSSVGGLDKQIAQIRDLIEIPLTRPELFRHLGLKPPRGILLHGPPGTGKTHLARAIAASTGSSVIIVNGPELSSAYHGETESKLRDVFTEARAKSPCIVVLDEVDAICPRREEGPGSEVEKRVVAQLLTIMDGMHDEQEEGKDRVVVVATTNRPNAIDPALRRPGRFDREMEIGVPDAEARFSILNVLLSKTPNSLTTDELHSLAARAYGYVGADLSAVVREAGTTAIKRWFTATTKNPDAPVPTHPVVTAEDLLGALTSVRPSALRSVFLDTAPVRYSDIGGQVVTIQKLRECIEWPLLHPDAFERLGVRPPKGVLLYGPPGCSKTLLVRACATESGVNFVAVKGPELLNKYVGESERAVREIFRKARAASPSMIFFDEIDALATSRSGDDSGGSHEGVLTSLLNEMDGVQELIGVTVVAATNRPDVIDSALMRPGRLDRILYVGPPDQEGRKEILHIRTVKMSVEPNLDIDELARVTDGCSGAEIVALCQEAALLTMKEDINAPYVPHRAFFAAAKVIKRQITQEVVSRYLTWQEANGVADA